MPLNPLSRSYIPTGRIHPASVEPAEVFDAQPSPISPQQLRMLDELLSQWIVQLSEEEDVMFGHQVRKRIFEEILVHGGTEITIDYPGQTPTLPGFTIKNSFDFDRRTSLLAAPLPDSTRLASTHHESLLHEAHWWVIAVMANSALSAIEKLKQIHGYLELLDRSAKDAARDGDRVEASARAVLRVVAVERFERKVNSSVQAIGEDAEPLMRSIREFGEWPEVVERCPLSGREQKPSQNLGSILPAGIASVADLGPDQVHPARVPSTENPPILLNCTAPRVFAQWLGRATEAQLGERLLMRNALELAFRRGAKHFQLLYDGPPPPREGTGMSITCVAREAEAWMPMDVEQMPLPASAQSTSLQNILAHCKGLIAGLQRCKDASASDKFSALHALRKRLGTYVDEPGVSHSERLARRHLRTAILDESLLPAAEALAVQLPAQFVDAQLEEMRSFAFKDLDWRRNEGRRARPVLT